MILTLTRYGTSPMGTFGELWLGSRRFYSIERPWADNKPFYSCVPNGEYELLWKPTNTPIPDEFDGNTWYLEGETVTSGWSGKPRSRCAIHVANIADNVNGCIGFGRGQSCFNHKWAVTASRDALSDIYSLIGGQDHELVIRSQECDFV